MSRFFVIYKNKLLALLFAISACVIFVSIVTYYPIDPSFNNTSEYPAKNILGIFGSYTADILLQLFGLSALVIAFIMFFLAARCYFSGCPKFLSLRLIVALLSAALVASFMALLPSIEAWPFYTGFGGYLGDVTKEKLLTILLDNNILLLSFIVVTVLFITFSSGVAFKELWYAGKFSFRSFAVILTFMAKIIAISAKTIAKVPLKLFANRQKKSSVDIGTNIDKDDELINGLIAKPYRGIKNNLKLGTKLKSERKKAASAGGLSKQLTMDFKRNSGFNFAPLTFLKAGGNIVNLKELNKAAFEQNARLLKKVLNEFGVRGEIINVRPGPVVTLYELEPSPGTKSSRVIGLSDDISRSMSALSTRIAVIPGRNAIGVELPNSTRETVYLRQLLESAEYNDERIKLPIALGKDIGGDTVIADLSRMPHLLIAGTTGSGKSVAINTMVLSFLYRMTPEECKFIMIDPKMLELSVYEGIPHLLTPVVTEPKKAVIALKWAVKEMENRYRLMSSLGVRNIAGYNKRVEEAIASKTTLERTVQTGFDAETGEPIIEKVPIEMKKLPFIVVIVDEMADLMLVAGKDIESLIQRLAQMARAAGIHIIMATQRPSVDVITGVIKANFPTRISFQVTSKIDSRTILGEQGAEQLLGMGDMLYMAGGSRITRVHGPFVEDAEVEKIVAFLKKQGKPEYIDDVTKDEEGEEDKGFASSGDSLYDQAVNIVLRDGKASTSYIQRQLKIGYNRAANLIEKMEAEGVVSPANHAGKREILVDS